MLSSDSIASLGEGRAESIYDQNSPVMSYLLGALDQIVSGTGLMLVFKLALFLDRDRDTLAGDLSTIIRRRIGDRPVSIPAANTLSDPGDLEGCRDGDRTFDVGRTRVFREEDGKQSGTFLSPIFPLLRFCSET
jgi:hypothetical protein